MYKQKGMGLVGFLVCMVTGVAISQFIVTPYFQQKGVSQMRGQPPTVTADYKQLVERYSKLPAPQSAPKGEFAGAGKIDMPSLFSAVGHPKKTDYQVTYYFSDDGSLTKEMKVAGQLMAGTADYSFQGSVMSFSNIKGDQQLFPQIGEPLTIDEGGITSHTGHTDVKLMQVAIETASLAGEGSL